MSEPLSREQVEKVLYWLGVDLRAAWRDDWAALGDTDAALRQQLAEMAAERDKWRADHHNVSQQLAELNESIAGLKKQTHQPTVTYWQNLYLQTQQEATQRFDQWFVLKQQLEETTRHLEAQRLETYQAVEREHALLRQLAAVTQERDDLVKCSYMGPMRDCPTHGETQELKLVRQQLAERDALIAKLQALTLDFKIDFYEGVKQIEQRDARIVALTEVMESLCHAIERGETDEDYMRNLADEGRKALAKGE